MEKLVWQKKLLLLPGKLILILFVLLAVLTTHGYVWIFYSTAIALSSFHEKRDKKARVKRGQNIRRT